MPGPKPQPCPACTTGTGQHRRKCPAKGSHGGTRKDPGLRVVLILSPAQLSDDAAIGELVRAKVKQALLASQA